MESALQLFKEGRHTELWERYCGHFDLSIEQFMTIQSQLLFEQIEFLSKCGLGKKLLCGTKPNTIDEFREKVPLTNYSDYVPYLSEKMEDTLPEKPIMWLRSSGRSEEHSYKWTPISERMYRELGNAMLAVFILGTCTGKGKINIDVNDKMLYGLAPPPYASGSWLRRLNDEGIFRSFPPVAEAEGMEFQERIEAGFKLALLEGLDVIVAIASVMVAIGDQLGKGGGGKRIGTVLKQPRQVPRLLKAVLKSKLAGRHLLPKDLWTLKGVITGGTDAFVYREKIKEMWGRYPFDVYGAGEALIIASQAWNYKNMTFVPYTNFYEFMTLTDYAKWQRDRNYRPRTFLLNEVVPGERYALIVTNFKGGVYTRYNIGDVIEITALRDEEASINLPQMAFYGRSDGNIDFDGFSEHAYFTEKLVWQGIVNSGISCAGWVARKEVDKGAPVLRLYIEPNETQSANEEIFTTLIHDEFKKISQDYKDLETFLGVNPLRVTLVANGGFASYTAKKKAAGADLAHLKPPHMNPHESVMQALMGERFVAGIAQSESIRKLRQS